MTYKNYRIEPSKVSGYEAYNMLDCDEPMIICETVEEIIHLINENENKNKELSDEQLVEQIILYQNNRNRVVDMFNHPELVNVKFEVVINDRSTNENYEKEFNFKCSKYEKTLLSVYHIGCGELKAHSYEECEKTTKERFYRSVLRRLLTPFFVHKIVSKLNDEGNTSVKQN